MCVFVCISSKMSEILHRKKIRKRAREGVKLESLMGMEFSGRGRENVFY